MTAPATTPASSAKQTPAHLHELAGELTSALLFVAAREINSLNILDLSAKEQRFITEAILTLLAAQNITPDRAKSLDGKTPDEFLKSVIHGDIMDFWIHLVAAMLKGKVGTKVGAIMESGQTPEAIG